MPVSCEMQVTPACLQAYYGIPVAPATQSSNRLGVLAFFLEYANNSDLQVYHPLRLQLLTMSLHGQFIPNSHSCRHIGWIWSLQATTLF